MSYPKMYEQGESAAVPLGMVIFGQTVAGLVEAVQVSAGSLSIGTPGSVTATAPAQTVVGTVAVQLLPPNANRKRSSVQNVGTTKICLAFGFTPTTSAYHIALPAGGSAGDGSSPVWADTLWQGAVSAIGSASGGLVSVCEMT